MHSLTDIVSVRELLNRHGFHFSKSLGQNFLINPSVCPRMAEYGVPSPEHGVLEIGPGIGVLTRELSARAARVAAIEIDAALFPLLDETVGACENVSVIKGDALKMDLHRVIGGELEGRPAAVCANLPYYITSPLIMKLLEERLPVECITVMVQKEAALRLCAEPGKRECGAVTLAVRYYAEPELLFNVSPGSFMPSPKVDSAVIRLKIRKSPPFAVKDEAVMFRLIRAGFGQRRKTLANALAGGGFDKTAAANAISAAGLDSRVRAENLTLEEFAELSDAYLVTERNAPEHDK